MTHGPQKMDLKQWKVKLCDPSTFEEMPTVPLFLLTLYLHRRLSLHKKRVSLAAFSVGKWW